MENNIIGIHAKYSSSDLLSYLPYKSIYKINSDIRNIFFENNVPKKIISITNYDDVDLEFILSNEINNSLDYEFIHSKDTFGYTILGIHALILSTQFSKEVYNKMCLYLGRNELVK